MKKAGYLILLLTVLQSCKNDPASNQTAPSSLQEMDSLKLDQTFNRILIDYPTAFLKSEGLEEWEDFEKLHGSLNRLSELNPRDVQVDLLTLSSRLKQVSKKTLPGILEVPQIRSRLKVVEMQVQKSLYFTQHFREDSLIPSLNTIYVFYNALVSRMNTLEEENAAVYLENSEDN